jgi:hypothetical protein
MMNRTLIRMISVRSAAASGFAVPTRSAPVD